MGEKSEKYKQMEKYIAKSRMLGLREFEFEYCEFSDSVSVVNICSDGTRQLKVPDFVSLISSCAWEDNEDMKNCNIKIPKGCYIDFEGLYDSFSNHVKSIKVDEDNEYYISVDGVLFDKEKKTLLVYPRGKEDKEYTIPRSVIKIEDKAFSYSDFLEKINIPKSVVWIGDVDFQTEIKIVVSKENPRYKSVRGCLYSKDGSVLYHLYAEQYGKIIIEDGTVIVKFEVPDGYYEELYIPKTIKETGFLKGYDEADIESIRAPKKLRKDINKYMPRNKYDVEYY